jgi:hypothetical protein
MRTCWLEPLIIALGLLSLVSCTDDKSTDDENAAESNGESTTTDGETTDGDTSCIPGELGCECNDGLCLADLVCNEGLCVEESTSSDTVLPCELPEISCDGICIDVTSDDANCGACGNECAVVLDAGGCVGGECSPTWSSCVVAADPLTSCTDLCQAEGFEACALCGPSSLSVIWFTSPMNCEIGQISDAEVGSCQIEPTADLSVYYSCCCAQ